jgi:hypothetical protein
MALAETARSRRQLVEEAGWRRTSGLSVLAGTLVAFGAVALIGAAAGAAGSALGIDTDGISTHEWRQAGMVGAAVGALVLFASFYFGGYTAGRMGRRAGARHGALVFLLSALLIGGIALIAWAMSGSLDVQSNLQDAGVPTNANTWSDIGIGAAIAAAAAMLLGSVLGGIRGDRWHGRLATAVVEHRDAEREAEMDRVRAQHSTTEVGDTPVDGTSTIDLRSDETLVDTADADRTELSIEEEREKTRS